MNKSERVPLHTVTRTWLLEISTGMRTGWPVVGAAGVAVHDVVVRASDAVATTVSDISESAARSAFGMVFMAFTYEAGARQANSRGAKGIGAVTKCLDVGMNLLVRARVPFVLAGGAFAGFGC
jgi:hypothetical protein